MKKIGLILSGCGVYDGAEIHESTLTLLAIDKLGHQAVCMAPNVEQMHVINHLNGEVMDESRNVLVEASRIARGDIRDIANVKTEELDALILPGGFGAAKNLSSFATEGASCSVHPEVERLVSTMHEAGKPLGFVCIAPAIAAKVLGKQSISLTIGNDTETATALEALGAQHIACTVTEFVEDRANKIVTSPAYMIGQRISEVATGIEKTVAAVCSML